MDIMGKLNFGRLRFNMDLGWIVYILQASFTNMG